MVTDATKSTDVIFTEKQTEVYSAPQVILENGMIAAKALGTVLAGKKKPVTMNGEQYLEFEDWELLGQFYGYTVKTGDAVECEVAGVKGAKAHADLVSLKTGQFLGGAEAYCMRDEDHWNTRAKYEWLENENGKRVKTKVGDEIVPWFQLASMAQTRAGAKAFRNRLAWVVVLAGFKATPAEELQGMTDNEPVEKKAEEVHFCKEHNTKFYKNDKNGEVWYSHKIKGTDPVKYCNEPKPEVIPTTAEPAQATTEPVKSEGITTPGQLCAWAYGHGKTYNMSWITKQLNVNQPDEIKDIPNAIATIKELTGWQD